MDLKAIQDALSEKGFDAWLFYDHHHRDPIAYSVLGLSDKLHVTRRWYYLLPAKGEPAKLMHRIEPGHLDPLPGKKEEYSSWQEQQDKLKAMLAPYKKLAMQYSPNNEIPYISLVDGGTIELVRSFGKEIVSSADLVARFEATWTQEQIASHFAAGKKIDAIMQASFKEIGERVRGGGAHEFEMQQWIAEAFRREGLTFDEAAVVGVNPNSGNPHYSPSRETSLSIRQGDFVLLDMWGKLDQPDSVYYDITWTGVVGGNPSERQQEVFRTVKAARDAGFERVKKAIAGGERIAGWQVDETTRKTIADAGYGQYFTHRTGHSIGTEVHANGANMDNLETKDRREIIANSCFSIEPGIYLPEFGIRTEFNVLVRKGSAEVTGRIQQELVSI